MQNLGFMAIDLGALPGVCDHVPFVLDRRAVVQVSSEVRSSGMSVLSVNGDIGDLNTALSPLESVDRNQHLEMLLALTADLGATALVLPCGALSHDPVRTLDEDLDLIAATLTAASTSAADAGVEIWVEAPHFFRLCWDMDRAVDLLSRLPPAVGVVMDFSHLVASGADPVEFVTIFHNRIRHVHIRDAVPGNINLSVGNGQVDFASGIDALIACGYTGHFALELETRDVTADQRPQATASAAAYISQLIERSAAQAPSNAPTATSTTKNPKPAQEHHD
ncbi:hypothetical protein MN0502_34870 (plasmid) [Arthrobacter sp. MN05-02]|nr:hypothetical protein MN0502_34870 [Arthrobacter sp. MN05-02]